MILVITVLLVPGLAAGLASKPFTPSQALAWPRRLVLGTCALAVAGFGFSLTRTWWVVHDWMHEAVITVGGGSRFVLTVVVLCVASVGLTIAGSLGHRNWAPLALAVAWDLMAWAWFYSTGEPYDSDASGEPRAGLLLATWALLLVTLTALGASILRVAEHRVAEPATARAQEH